MTGGSSGRGTPTLRVEHELLRTGYRSVAGIDEVGRGAIAGPVTVGVAVITADTGSFPVGLADSKLLTPAGRERLAGPVRRWVDDAAVAHATAQEIDRIGIIAALRLAALRALSALSRPPDVVLLDGNYDYLTAVGRPERTAPSAEAPDAPGFAALAVQWPELRVPDVRVRVKADRDCAAVAAASILAKITRDALMVDYAHTESRYGWAANKGYATPLHRAALRRWGPCERHRLSWRPARPDGTPAVGNDGAVAACSGRRGVATRTDVKGA